MTSPDSSSDIQTAPAQSQQLEQPERSLLSGITDLIASARKKLIGSDPHKQPRLRRNGNRTTGEMVEVTVGMLDGSHRKILYDKASMMPSPQEPNSFSHIETHD